MHTIGASSAAGFAVELEGDSNGVFTSAVIEAVRDLRVDINQDNLVTVQELRRHVAHRVPELTGNFQRPSVVSFERDQNIILNLR